MFYRTFLMAAIVCFTKGGCQNIPENAFASKDGEFLRTETQNILSNLLDSPEKTVDSMSKTKQGHSNKKVTRGIIFLNEEYDVPIKQSAKFSRDRNESHSSILRVTTENDDTGEGSGDHVLNFTSTHFFPSEAESYQQTSKKFESHSTTTDMESSGDHETSDSNKFQETTEISFDSANFTLSDSCLNQTCDISDLIIHGAEKMPERSNLTLKCTSNSFKESSTFVYWYRYNGTNYNLEIYQHQQVNLMLPITKLEDSGKYVCVRMLEDQSCCHKEIYITIYEVPPYKYHLLAIGLAAAIFLLTCLSLAAYRSHVMRKYTKQFATIRSKEKPLLI